MKRLAVSCAVLALAAAVAGCGGGGAGGGNDLASASSAAGDGASDGDGGSGTELTVPDEVVAATGDPVEITARDNSFDAPAVRVPAGTTVRWTNRGRQDHDVIAVEGEWGAEVADFHPGDSYQRAFAQPGTYHYYCTIHGTAARGMVGVVVVE